MAPALGAVARHSGGGDAGDVVGAGGPGVGRRNQVGCRWRRRRDRGRSDRVTVGGERRTAAITRIDMDIGAGDVGTKHRQRDRHLDALVVGRERKWDRSDCLGVDGRTVLRIGRPQRVALLQDHMTGGVEAQIVFCADLHLGRAAGVRDWYAEPGSPVEVRVEPKRCVAGRPEVPGIEMQREYHVAAIDAAIDIHGGIWRGRVYPLSLGPVAKISVDGNGAHRFNRDAGCLRQRDIGGARSKGRERGRRAADQARRDGEFQRWLSGGVLRVGHKGVVGQRRDQRLTERSGIELRRAAGGPDDVIIVTVVAGRLVEIRVQPDRPLRAAEGNEKNKSGAVDWIAVEATVIGIACQSISLIQELQIAIKKPIDGRRPINRHSTLPGDPDFRR